MNIAGVMFLLSVYFNEQYTIGDNIRFLKQLAITQQTITQQTKNINNSININNNSINITQLQCAFLYW